MADAGNHADASAFRQPKLKSYQLPNRKESMQNIDLKIPETISLRVVTILITRLGSNTVIYQSRLC